MLHVEKLLLFLKHQTSPTEWQKKFMEKIKAIEQHFLLSTLYNASQRKYFSQNRLLIRYLNDKKFLSCICEDRFYWQIYECRGHKWHRQEHQAHADVIIFWKLLSFLIIFVLILGRAESVDGRFFFVYWSRFIDETASIWTTFKSASLLDFYCPIGVLLNQ